MKKSILIIAFSFLFFSSANSTEKGQIYNNLEITENLDFSPCTVTIKGNFDGVEVDLEVTVDATWFECVFLKKGIKDAIKKALE
jgi:type 1 fimbria pilin